MNSVGEDRSKIFKTYCGPLPIDLYWCELVLDTCRSGDLIVASSCDEEHDERGTIRFYKVSIREYTMEFDYPLASGRAPAQKELKIAEHVSAYNDGDTGKVAHIGEHEEELRKFKAYHRNVRRCRASVSKIASLKDDNLS